MPNHNCMLMQHVLWPGEEFGDTKIPDTGNTACMKDCADEAKVASFLLILRGTGTEILPGRTVWSAPHLVADTTHFELRTSVAARTVAATVAAPAPEKTASPNVGGAGTAVSKAASALTE